MSNRSPGGAIDSTVVPAPDHAANTAASAVRGCNAAMWRVATSLPPRPQRSPSSGARSVGTLPTNTITSARVRTSAKRGGELAAVLQRPQRVHQRGAVGAVADRAAGAGQRVQRARAGHVGAEAARTAAGGWRPAVAPPRQAPRRASWPGRRPWGAPACCGWQSLAGRHAHADSRRGATPTARRRGRPATRGGRRPARKKDRPSRRPAPMPRSWRLDDASDVPEWVLPLQHCAMACAPRARRSHRARRQDRHNGRAAKTATHCRKTGRVGRAARPLKAWHES